MLNLYKFLSIIFLPIIILNLYLRVYLKKEDKKRYFERFGITTKKIESAKEVIWIHAASVGEFKSSDIIIDRYHKDFYIVVTTTTKTAANYIKLYYNEKVTHQYIPFDIPFWCSKFLNFWQPKLILWIESDIWPNMLKLIKDRKISCLYLNARISPKSFNKWKYLNNLYSNSLDTFNKIYAQSIDDLKRMEKLTNKKIKYIGNLKLSHKKISPLENKKNQIITLMLVSTHKDEEELILKNIQTILINHNLKIYIAPRHPERSESIKKMLKKYNLIGSFEDDKVVNTTIINTFGNLENYFNKSDIVILGGSFVKKGGHNPLEPAKYNCALITGNFIYNWQNIYDDMLKEKACIMLTNIKELKNKIYELITNKLLLNDLKKQSFEFSKKTFFKNKELFNEINLILEKKC